MLMNCSSPLEKFGMTRARELKVLSRQNSAGKTEVKPETGKNEKKIIENYSHMALGILLLCILMSHCYPHARPYRCLLMIQRSWVVLKMIENWTKVPNRC